MKRSRSRKIRRRSGAFRRGPRIKQLLLAPTPVPAVLKGKVQPDTKAYRSGDLSIFVSSIYGWHLSIAHPERYPTWDELADVRYQLIPDKVTMAMVMPPSDRYVNLHPNTFQIVQITPYFHYRPEQWDKIFGVEGESHEEDE